VHGGVAVIAAGNTSKNSVPQEAVQFGKAFPINVMQYKCFALTDVTI